MKLNEILDKPLPFKVIQNEPDEFMASFNAGDREIQFYGQNEGAMDGDDEGVWEIIFGEMQSKKRTLVLPGQNPDEKELTYKKTGSGKEIEVFSTLKAILEKFIKSREPKMIRFSADKTEGNRARLYARLFKKNLPGGWRLDTDDNGFEHEPVFFQMVKEALDKPLPYEVKKATRYEVVAEFEAEGRKLQFHAKYMALEVPTWEITFGEPGGERLQMKKTGKGDEFAVFATVKKILLDFVNEYEPEALRIESFKGEPSRTKLYQRMIMKSLPSDWKAVRDDTGETHTAFTLRKQ